MTKVDIRTKHMQATEAMRAHVTRKVEEALARHPGAVTRATLRASDINGPRGGNDLLCSLVLQGPRLGPLVGQVTHTDFYVATSKVIKKVGLALDQAVRRGRFSSKRHGAPAPQHFGGAHPR
jgi:putative sigma-54 modulation protein